MQSLDRENVLVLQVVQAAIGLISAKMQAISVQMDDENVIVHFAVRQLTSEIQEDIDDIMSELDALLPGRIKSEALIHVGDPDSSWIGRDYRKVYMEKPPVAD
ncbi:hypothetical protein [Amycolatopsis sp. GA6-003]|uniref:hypothetical protein n=1 Tax=Amycolatopsis sp. GA6-003 TaxID=2652444 RepID=UPI003916FB20